MKRSRWIGWGGLLLIGVLFTGAFSQNPSPEELRKTAEPALKNGNWKVAYEALRKLCLDEKNDPKQVGQDLNKGVQCLNNLGRVNEVDEFIEATVAAHKKNWRLLQEAATIYAHAQHQGFIIAGKFERGHHRGGGKYVNSIERDRVRAMQLMADAVSLAKLDDDKPAVGRFYLQFGELMLNHRGIYEAWRLQYLTDLATLPDYEEGWYGYREYNGASVDAEGKPVYHYSPKSWEAAETDGQRWRWVLDQAVENHPAIKLQVKMQLATFWQQMFGVESMQYARWNGSFASPGDDDTKKDESGTYALHTLKDDETIAKLATGIKRFMLPDEFNALKIYAEVAKEQGAQAEQAGDQLARCYENRRQYPKAASVWQEQIKKFGPGNNDWRNAQLKQIVGAWGQFEFTSALPAGKGATVDFKFRNGKKVKFEARPIKVDELLNDVKAYLKSDPGNQIDWNKLNIGNIGYRLVHQNETKYLAEGTAGWDLDLEPRANHFDKRITVTTPLQKAGAYLVTATMADGNVSKIVLWVADSALVKQTLNGKNLYFAADAVSGAPLAGANLEFFGWQHRHLGGNRFQVVTSNFAETASADGLVTPDPRDLKTDHNWLVTLRGKEGSSRLAFLGFQNVWDGRYYDAEYNAVKVFGVTDRPVYRPEQKVEFKFWVRRAQYDNDGSDFAKQSFVVEIRNPKGEVSYSKSLTADEFAGISDEFPLPKDATLGQYHFTVMDAAKQTHYQVGGNYFRVEEYKKPEYEVTVDAPSEPVMLGEKITAKVTAKYYFGSPVTKAKVKYKIMRSNYSQNWYPTARWDWAYEPGYWWFGYDYTWYKGFNSWCGCRRPLPPWYFRGRPQPPELVAEVEREIGAEGTVDMEIDTAIAKELHPDTDHEYTITAEVRDESRRTIVGTGKVLVARKPFKVFSWVDRGYYRVGDVVMTHFQAQTLDRKPVEGKGELKLLKITYDKDAQPIETPVQSWKVNTNEEGRAEQQIKASEKGQYRLSYVLTDKKDHKIEGGYIFTIIGDGFDGKEFAFNHLELVPDKAEYAPGETVKMQLNADRANGTVLFFVRPANGVYLEPKVIRLKGKSVIEEIAVVKKDMPNFFVEAVTVADGKVYTETKEVVVPPEKRVLNVEVLPSSKTYKPGEKGKVKVKVTDHTGEGYAGTTIFTMYDKSVEYISGGSNVPAIKEFFWKWRRHHNPQHQDNLSLLQSTNIGLPNVPGMAFLGVFGASVADEAEGGAVEMAALGNANGFGGGRGGGGLALRKGEARANMLADGAMPQAAKFAAAAPSAPGKPGDAAMDRLASTRELQSAGEPAADGGSGGGENLQEPTVRSNFADTAKWVATLNTGKDGLAEVEVDMPENLTGWKIRVWGLGQGTRVGSGDADVVTRKNLIVRLQAPRFFVQKDEVVLTANVHNYLDKEKDVTVVLDIPADKLETTSQKSVKVKIPAGGEKRVDWRCKVTNEGEILVKMKALTDEESDAMQMKLPSYVHGMLKMESWAGTVRPDKQTGKVAFVVPKERRVEQSLLEVRYSPSLAMAMVDALPYLAEYPYGCTEQTLNRFLPAAITQKTLIEMKLDLAAIKDKRTNLNAQEIGDDVERAKQWKRFDRNPVFDKEELDRMVKDGLKALTEQQVSDGGWGWFSGAGEHSFPHTTAVVVHGLQIAKQNDVALVPGVLERGVEWLKRYQAGEVEKIKNYTEKKDVPNIPKKVYADALDAFVYMILCDADSENKEMREYLFRDKNHVPVYGKAVFGIGLHKVGDKEKLDMIMQNMEQYLVQDAENESAYLKLPTEGWWWWYGDEVEANAYYLKLLSRTEPTKERAPRLVKYLLNNRKHATYWKSTRDTAVCVEAFSEFVRASGEQQPDMTVELYVDGEKKKEVEINAGNLFTYDNKFVLKGAEVKDGSHEVEIRRKGKGPVYFNAYLTNFTLEDHITKAGLEIKVDRQYYKLEKVDKKIKVEGGRGQVVDQKVEKYERKPLKEGDTLKSGDLVEIELVMESKNDYEYILFEDMKAAGFEPVDVRSGYTNNGLGAYTEFRDNRVSFFVRQLARGKHSLAYRMRAEIPGKFAALPTKASAMYAPELKGNSDEIKLSIED